LLEKVIPQNTTFDDFEITNGLKRPGWRKMRLNARRIPHQAGQRDLILLAFEDLHDIEKKLHEQNDK
jgi:hypothetical protein